MSSQRPRSKTVLCLGVVLLIVGGATFALSSIVGIPLFGDPSFLADHPEQATSLGLGVLTRLAAMFAGLAIVFRPGRSAFPTVLTLGLSILTAAADVFIYLTMSPSRPYWVQARSAHADALIGSLFILGLFIVITTAVLVLNRGSAEPADQPADDS